METRSPSEPPEGAKAAVYICDDSETVRTVIASYLADRYDCHLFERAEHLLAACEIRAPDLILSDLVMDGIGGYELCRRVREEPRLKSVPVVLLTSKADEESRAIGLEIGADDYLFQPIRPRELLARVASLVRIRRSSEQLAARTRQLERANRELKQAYGALVQAEKLASIGTLVAGVAHEINNPLAFMKSGMGSLGELIDELLSVLPDTQGGAAPPLIAEMREIVDEVQAGILRLQRIAEDLRTSASGALELVEDVPLAEEVQRQWKLACLTRLAKPRLALEVDPALSVRTIRQKLGQALLNVLVNAIQAINGVGTVTVAVEESEAEVRLCVRDSGPGISPEHLSRIFDPFFTTRPIGEGVGLGLSVSLGLLRSLGGSIRAASEPGRGAEFVLSLPRVANVTPAQSRMPSA